MGTASTRADTRMMGIVHGALCRDLERARAALTAEPYPRDRRRRAVGEHVVWMMEFLHAHHTGEDEGLWPIVRERNPAAGPLLDSLDADHRQIEPGIARLKAAGLRYAATDTDEPRVEVIAALDALTSGLLPHLERVVELAMPVVSASITQAEWKAWGQKYYVRTKSFAELGIEGHWLLDGLDSEGRRLVVRQVPAVPRFILLRGFAGKYRRQAAARWGADIPGTNG
ncbi:hypothetical protein Acor_78100 [Acrocarpospora corrugata]|uniref:Hemerythrin-like domain-containing protein n=1 Tax=Acrocarpospora corrugata TaxID=35763 RepID=A0A5M3WCF9_9ACTN|nr:hemerythrin domain-containing protein [Acrocarpospora corrugata]GES05742.1 hypothetical protein Acor_78100 [Acrocarpospora corrugata]